MIIDGHAHAAREFSNIETLLKQLNKYNIDKVILCPSLKNKIDISDPPKIFMSKKERSTNNLYSSNKFIRMTYRLLKENGDPNAFVSNLRQQAPDRIIQFYWLDFNNPNILEDLINSTNKYHYKGLKIHQSWTSFSIKSDIFHQIISFAEINNLPIFIHPHSLKDVLELKNISKFYPHCNFIIAHFMGITVFEDYSGNNIYHDMSPHDISTKELITVINKYGSSKVLFGSDTPFGRIDDNLKKVQSLKIKNSEKDNILGLNIKKLIDISF